MAFSNDIISNQMVTHVLTSNTGTMADLAVEIEAEIATMDAMMTEFQSYLAEDAAEGSQCSCYCDIAGGSFLSSYIFLHFYIKETVLVV